MLAMQRLEKNVNFPQTVVPTKSAVCKRRVLEHCAEYSGEVKATCVSRELAAHRDFGIGSAVCMCVGVCSVCHADRLRPGQLFKRPPCGSICIIGMRGADRGGGGRRREIIGPLKLKYKSNKSADVSRFRRHTLIESEGLLQNEPEQVCLSACCDDGWLRGRNSDSDSLNLNEPEPRGGRE
ncbi:hypothetical protein F2P81_023265 [Scophthalmus maximus]|uniref:Uncharacterized protein n=1 Tax=Scophthalmus maximus TaxID=52904 RepID=A0A6A4RR09_SCOMX|nr:hypothetical protein F2P81_023265 [Scophthalmus maximus]